jgi:aryl-alcohol dehydrogenase-like predicted oxidoreductase
VATIDRAIELGITMLDTSDMYGRGHNEELIGRAIRGKRAQVFLATKFGIVREGNSRKISGRPDHVKAACEASLKRLGVSTIDLYYQHRVDPDTPIEDTVGAMKELVDAGKARHLGLSEAGTDTIRRAYSVHPIAALQTEYSLWSRDPEDDLLPLCRELGIAFVAYSPLGRGFLTGHYRKVEAFGEGDFRRITPRFQVGNIDKNLALVDRLDSIARDKGCSTTQLALAWVLAQGEDIVPIPGTKRRKYLEENVSALDVALTGEDLRAIEAAVPRGAAVGPRYPEAVMREVGR